jgi:hypothetical protein
VNARALNPIGPLSSFDACGMFYTAEFTFATTQNALKKPAGFHRMPDVFR